MADDRVSPQRNAPSCQSAPPPVVATSEPGPATCAECGAEGAVDFGHVQLCAECYAVKGACCAIEERDTA